MEQNKIDIKYIGVPNICFSLTKANDKREKQYSEQRKTRGFDESETWSLRDTIASFILPRIEVFRKIKIGRPADLTPEEWEEILIKIETAFAVVINDNTAINTEEDWKKYEEGMRLFHDYFLDLWW